MNYDKDSQYGFSELERKMNASILALQNRVDVVDANVDSLTNRVVGLNTLNYGEIVNLLDNSHPEWSTEAYTTLGVLPGTVTDLNREAYNFYRQLSSDTALVKSAANALKGTGHSLFAANEGTDLDIPRWDVVNGQIELGGITNFYDLVYQLPNELVFPGLVFYLQFEAQLRTSTPMPSNLQFFAALYDNTIGQQKVIEGGNFTITGDIFGTPGSRSIEYQVRAKTDSGEEAISNTLAFANAPDTFTQNNHPRINFRGAPGFIEFEIYRKEVASSTFVLQYVVRNAIEGTYFDVGNEPVRVVSSFPGVSATPPRAYAKTRTFQPGSITGAGFVRHTLTIQVPTTYNSSLTGAGMQWLRLGLVGATTDARQILIRRIGLSLGDGGWSRSANDVREGAHSTRTSTAASSPSGGSGTGTGVPPSPGSGGCVLLDSLVTVYDEFFVVKQITLRELQSKCLKEGIYCFSAGAIGGRVLSIKQSYASRILHIESSGGLKISATHNHPFITNPFDIAGTPASQLKVGDEIIAVGKEIAPQRIVSITEEFGDFVVGIPVLDGSHICVLNGFVSHNVKLPEEII